MLAALALARRARRAVPAGRRRRRGPSPRACARRRRDHVALPRARRRPDGRRRPDHRRPGGGHPGRRPGSRSRASRRPAVVAGHRRRALAVVLVTRAPGHDAATGRRASSGRCSAALAIGAFNVCIGQLSGRRRVRARWSSSASSRRGILAGVIVLGPPAVADAARDVLAGSSSSACWTWPATPRSSSRRRPGDARDRRRPVVALPGRRP